MRRTDVDNRVKNIFLEGMNTQLSQSIVAKIGYVAKFQ